MSIFIFTDILSDHANKGGLIVWLLTIFYLLIPVRYIIMKCSKDVHKYDEMTHEKHYLTFWSDYDRANPMSEKEANIRFLEKMKEEGKVDKNEFDMQKYNINQGGRFGGVLNYGAQVNNMQSRVLNVYQQPMMFGHFAPRPQVFNNGYQAMGYNPMQGMPPSYARRIAFVPQNGVYAGPRPDIPMHTGGFRPQVPGMMSRQLMFNRPMLIMNPYQRGQNYPYPYKPPASSSPLQPLPGANYQQRPNPYAPPINPESAASRQQPPYPAPALVNNINQPYRPYQTPPVHYQAQLRPGVYSPTRPPVRYMQPPGQARAQPATQQYHNPASNSPVPTRSAASPDINGTGEDINKNPENIEPSSAESVSEHSSADPSVDPSVDPDNSSAQDASNKEPSSAVSSDSD